MSPPWLRPLLLMLFARIHHAQIKTTHQSQEECLTECACSHSVNLSVFSKQMQWWMKTTTKQPSNEKTAHLSFAKNSFHNKDKDKEKQAKKKELDRAAMWGEALEAALERSTD